MQYKTLKVTELDTCPLWKLATWTVYKHAFSFPKRKLQCFHSTHPIHIINGRGSQTTVCVEIACGVITSELQISEARPEPAES